LLKRLSFANINNVELCGVVRVMSAILYKFLSPIRHFTNLVISGFPISTSIACTIVRYRVLRHTGLYPRRIKVPDSFTIYINDPATLTINIPDRYIRKEYELHPAYIPSKGWTVLDVGAYVGLFSMRASRLVGDSGRVVAFEPNPLAYYWLRRNIALNRLSNVEALPIALGSYDGVTELYIVLKGNIGVSSIFRNHLLKQGEASGSFIVVKVPMRKLDSIAEKLRLNHVDLVKIDVEGAELEVLRGSRGLMERGGVEKVVVEVHIDVVNEEDVRDFLVHHGFRIDKSVNFGNVKKIFYARLVK